jgi:GNAT superfamily N-acetyltransferase
VEDARLATTDDLPRLQALLELAYEVTPSHRGGALFGHPFRMDDVRNRVLSAIDNEHECVIAGLIDDYIVGVSVVGIDDSFPDGPIGVVQELFVEPDARGVGTGEAMLDLVVMWCRERGCAGVDLAVLPGDRNAKNLCERSGFSARLLIMYRALN